MQHRATVSRVDNSRGLGWWVGASFLVILSVAILGLFFVDLIAWLGLKGMPEGVLKKAVSMSGGIAMAMAIPICGFMAGSRVQSAKSATKKIGALLVGLGVCIGMARYAKSAQAAREKTEVEFQKKWSAAQTQIDEGKRRLVSTLRAERRWQ